MTTFNLFYKTRSGLLFNRYFSNSTVISGLPRSNGITTPFSGTWGIGYIINKLPFKPVRCAIIATFTPGSSGGGENRVWDLTGYKNSGRNIESAENIPQRYWAVVGAQEQEDGSLRVTKYFAYGLLYPNGLLDGLPDSINFDNYHTDSGSGVYDDTSYIIEGYADTSYNVYPAIYDASKHKGLLRFAQLQNAYRSDYFGTLIDDE